MTPKKLRSNIDQVERRLKKLQTQRIVEKLVKLKLGLSLTDPWPFTKYKNNFCVEYVIAHDPEYVQWCLENTDLKLDKQAEEMYMYEMELIIQSKGY